ncbi:MAG: amidohydrolase family protein [Actinobacteria bacterium]|nr:amidohydrolase family protein [Actinomycetota bacterium]
MEIYFIQSPPAGGWVPEARSATEDEVGEGATVKLADVIDVHTHFIPREYLDADDHPEWGARIEDRGGVPWIVHDEGFAYPFHPTFLCEDAKFEDMRKRSIDLSVVSLAPTLFYYWIDAADAVAFARMANDSLAKAVVESGGKLFGLASLPMQDPEGAAIELRRAVEELGMVGAQIGTTMEGDYIDRDRFLPVWEAANELKVPFVLHPYYVGPKSGYEDYYLTNIFVNPMDTAIAASRVIFSGLLDRFPDITLMLVHAGGFLPFQIGRLDHGWKVREEPKHKIDRRPSEYMDRFYLDTITHNDSALRWLIELVGANRVVLGTDLPFDMADEDPVGRLERTAEGTTRARIGAANAADLFGLREKM